MRSVLSVQSNTDIHLHLNAHAIHLPEEERAGYFTLLVFLLSCGCLCSVSLPCGAVIWCVVFVCGVSRSYSLAFHARIQKVLSEGVKI